MSQRFKFHKSYFIATILLFIAEVLIALYVNDKIIRPYFGDFLVVILLYCFVKSFLNSPVSKTCLLVLLFAYLVETLQYFNFVHHLGLANSKLANIILGNHFAWIDILAYTLGIFTVPGIERLRFLIQKGRNGKDEKSPLFI